MAAKHDSVQWFRPIHIRAGGGARLLFAVLLLGGVVYATPIVSFNDVAFQNPNDFRGRAIAQKSQGKSAVAAKSGMVSGTRFEVVNASVLSDACLFTNDCNASVRVPEPQSLMLVGSGLLAMAGLVRRRLIR
jgi:hypothetical protein